MTDTTELPPLPEQYTEQVIDYSGIAVNRVDRFQLFTADQMRAYAAEAVRVALESAQMDGERLDWFADHIISIEDDCRISATWRLECDRGYFRGDSIRAAIDAAMKATP